MKTQPCVCECSLMCVHVLVSPQKKEMSESRVTQLQKETRKKTRWSQICVDEWSRVSIRFPSQHPLFSPPVISAGILNWCVSLFLPVNRSRSPTPSARRCVETSRTTRPKQKPSAASASPSPACSPTDTHTHTHSHSCWSDVCVCWAVIFVNLPSDKRVWTNAFDVLTVFLDMMKQRFSTRGRQTTAKNSKNNPKSTWKLTLCFTFLSFGNNQFYWRTGVHTG